jgi:hypothetical protein
VVERSLAARVYASVYLSRRQNATRNVGSKARIEARIEGTQPHEWDTPTPLQMRTLSIEASGACVSIM